jgi:ABC-type branched-subunit amino acid transport system substrate-binding protein
MKKAGIITLIVGGALILLLFLNPYKGKATVGILLPTDDVSAHFDARVGFLTAMKSLPKDVDFMDIDYTSTSLVQAMKNAVKRGIRYFVADGYSSDFLKIDGLLEKTHSILMETMVTNPIMLKKAKYAFTIAPTDDIQASAIAAYLENMKYKNVVIVKDDINTVYVNYLADTITEDLKSIKAKSIFIYNTEEVVKAPDAFVLIMSPDNVINVISKLKVKFPKAAFIGSDWTFYSSLLEHLSVSNGMVTVGFVDPIYLQSKLNQKVSNKNLTFTPVGVLAYDALKTMYILAKERVSYADAEKYLNSHSFFGVGGVFTFNGIHATTPVYFYKITPSGFKLTWKFGGKS